MRAAALKNLTPRAAAPQQELLTSLIFQTILKPLSFHIELTDKCNARCVQCSRNFIDNDGKLKERPELCLTEISLEQYKNIKGNKIERILL